jgi:hypothetical protein
VLDLSALTVPWCYAQTVEPLGQGISQGSYLQGNQPDARQLPTGESARPKAATYTHKTSKPGLGLLTATIVFEGTRTVDGRTEEPVLSALTVHSQIIHRPCSSIAPIVIITMNRYRLRFLLEACFVRTLAGIKGNSSAAHLLAALRPAWRSVTMKHPGTEVHQAKTGSAEWYTQLCSHSSYTDRTFTFRLIPTFSTSWKNRSKVSDSFKRQRLQNCVF